MEMLCGDGGLIQAPLYDEGWVDDSFGAAYEAEHDYAFGWMAAEVDAIEPFDEEAGRPAYLHGFGGSQDGPGGALVIAKVQEPVHRNVEVA